MISAAPGDVRLAGSLRQRRSDHKLSVRMTRRIVRFGVIGAGMMGRHFAATAARWGELSQPVARPEIVAVCNRSRGPLRWFEERLPNVTQFVDDYRSVLATPA